MNSMYVGSCICTASMSKSLGLSRLVGCLRLALQAAAA